MTTMANNDRDLRLDIAKGFAITLVVIGHVIQANSQNFDELFIFRAIYSFHMPLFIFLSGAVASIWYKPEIISAPAKVFWSSLGKRLKNTTLRLIPPFISWALISNWIRGTGLSAYDVLITAFKRPDTGLWFLICIFYCVVVLSIFQIFFFTTCHLINNKNHSKHTSQLQKFLLNKNLQLGIVFILWSILRAFIPPGAGLPFIKNYFGYYLLGLVFYTKFRGLKDITYRISIFIIFIGLAQFWQRNTVNNIATTYEQYLSIPILSNLYVAITAVLGIICSLDLIESINNLSFNPIKIILAFLGKISLGIYAIHYFFLSTEPYVIAPIILSSVLSVILLQFRITRVLLLGEK